MIWPRVYRPPDVVPDRGAASALLLCTAATGVLHAPHQPPVVNVGGLLLLAWAVAIAYRGARAPGRWLRAVLVAAVVFLIVRDHGTVLGRDAGVSLLLLLLVLKLTELRRARDYRIAVFLVYFATLAAFLFSQGPGTAAAAAVLALATTWTLHRINHPGALLAAQGFRTALGAVLYALPLMALLYLFFPRLAGGLVAIPAPETAGRIGLTDRVAPGSIQQLLSSDAPAFRAFFAGAPPPNAELYWRALVLTENDARGWRTGTRGYYAPPAVTPESEPLEYRLQLEPSPQRAVPALGWPASTPSGAFLRPGGVLRAQHELFEARRFELSSYLRYRDRDAQPLPGVPRLDARVRALVQELAGTSRDPRALADALLRHFRAQPFRYTLAPPALPDDWLAAFLFETRAGYCEHYASAFATLMRAAGVPSRVITGYQGGDWNAAGGFLLVRQSDAHAWVEIFLPEEGWRRVDPTAAVAPERVEHGIEALRALEARGTALGTLAPEALRKLIVRPWWRSAWRGAQQRYDAFLVKWNVWVSEYDRERQLRLLRKLGFADPGWPQLVGILAAGAALLLSLVAAALFRVRADADPVRRSWDRFCRRLARAGVARAPHEGPLDFARRASARLPASAPEIEAIGRLYARLRYARPRADLLPELARRVRRLRISRENPPARATTPR